MRIFILLIFLLTINIPNIYSQSNLIEILKNEGLQNIQYHEDENDIYLSYENNRYRFEAEAMAFVLKALSNSFELTNKEVSILIKNKGIAMSLLKTSLENLRLLNTKEISFEEWLKRSILTIKTDAVENKLNKEKLISKSFGKIDVPVGLQLDYQLGNFDNAIRLRLNIQPEITTVFSKGWTASANYSITTFNDLSEKVKPRLVIARISKDFRYKNIMINISGGSFTRNRLGLSTLTHYYFLNSEQFRIEGSYSKTNFGYFDSNFSIYSREQNREMYYIGLNYRNIKFNTDINFRYGKHLYQDTGFKLNITRQINEVFIGFFLHQSKGLAKRNVGFEFQVPIGTKKHLKPTAVRPMTKEFFYLPYYYSGSGAGFNFYSGENALINMKEYFPGTIKTGLKKYF